MGESAVDRPEAIERAQSVLFDQGFQVVSERDGGIGTQLILRGTLATDDGAQPAWVEIVGDRGRWSVTLRFRQEGVAVTPSLWEAYLEGRDVRDPDIDADVTFLAVRLQDAARAVAANPGLEARLYEDGREYMRRRLGLPLSGTE